MKRRILHAIGALSKGGAEHQCSLLLNNLDPEFYDISIMYFYEGPRPALAKHIKQYKIERGGYLGFSRLYRSIRELLTEERPEIVHVWLPEIISVPTAMAARSLRIPIVCGHRNTFNSGTDFMRAIRDRIRGIQYLISDKIISNFCVNEEPFLFRLLYKFKNGISIENGIDFDSLQSVIKKELPNRATYRIIFAGRLTKQKGLPVLFNAIQLLALYGRDVHLTLFGDGEENYVKELKDIVDNLGIEKMVSFMGFNKEWYAYSLDAFCLAFPTQGEGTSNVVIEALASRLPVVISNIAMSRQLLRNESNAIVVSKNDAQKWADSLMRLMDDPSLREDLVTNGYQLSESFSLLKMAQKYDRMYKALL